MRVMRWGSFGVGLFALIGCGSVTEDPESCELRPGELEKSWFVGEDLVSAGDDPTFRLTMTAVSAKSAATPAFVGETAGFDVRFEIAADHLFARALNDGDMRAVWAIQSHHSPCAEQVYCSVPGGGACYADDRPWHERSRFKADLSVMLIEHHHRFDAASTIDPEAATYTPVAHLDPTQPILAGESLSVTNQQWIEWNSPACVVDFPELADGEACPVVELSVRYDFVRVAP